MPTKKTEQQSPIERAMSIERLKPVQDGVYVCTNAKTKKYEVVPLSQVNIVINGNATPLGELLENLVNGYNKIIDHIIDNNNNK
ncbi:MAG: hypothetical protein J6R47_03590 [Acholeplasmatales bacterium]|nr:hypothetical protein [Acholeplasmatales bacterium]